MTQEQIKDIFDEIESNWKRDNAFQGLQILSRYTDSLIEGANHDIIYGPYVEDMINAGITVDDCEKLAKLNWHIEDDKFLLFYLSELIENDDNRI